MNYKDFIKQYTVSQGGNEIGVTFNDIQEYLLTPARYREFEHFMRGQTCGMIGGISVCYTCDLERFMCGLPNND